MDEQTQTNDDVPDRTPDLSGIKKYAFASKMALEADHVGYCYRQTPETNIDSGWRFLYGSEDEEYLDDHTVSVSVYPEDMLSVNPALDRILSAPVGSEFEWDEEQEMYVELRD